MTLSINRRVLRGIMPRLALLAVVAGLGIGCGDNGRETAATAGASTDAEATVSGQTYHVRGVILQVMGRDNALGQLQIHHEAVPGFVDLSGQAVGMKSMIMPFRVADDVALDQLGVGDKVSFTWHVDWNKNIQIVTAIEKLPASTKLDFETRPERAAPATSETMPVGESGGH